LALFGLRNYFFGFRSFWFERRQVNAFVGLEGIVLFGFRRFLFERREGGNFVEFVASTSYNVFFSRRALAVFCSSRAFEVP
jgi:hypothetical protein